MKKYIFFLFFLTLFSLSIIAQHAYDFKGLNFDTLVDFRFKSFSSAVLFNNAIFKKETRFDSTIFNSVAYFPSAEFHATTSFYKTTIKSNANFNLAHFYSSVNFHYAIFKSGSYAGFQDVYFDSIANFKAAEFNNTANFTRARFKYLANFSYAKFYSLANFYDASFDSILDFSHAQFHSKTYFLKTRLPQAIDLSYVVVIKEGIDLTRAIIDSTHNECKINLTFSNIDKITFKYSRFKLYFDDTTDIESKATVYEKLLLKQKKEGFIKSYEKLDKEYKEFWYLEGGGYGYVWGFVQNFFSKCWWGYGYEKVRIFKNTFYIFIFFFIINTIIWLRNRGPKIYDVPRLQIMRESVIHTSYLKKVLKSLYISFFYTSIVFFGLKFNLERLNYDNKNIRFKKCRLIGFFILYLSGIICLAYLANFVLSN